MYIVSKKKKKASNEDYLCSKELYPLSSCCLCVFVLPALGTEAGESE